MGRPITDADYVLAAPSGSLLAVLPRHRRRTRHTPDPPARSTTPRHAAAQGAHAPQGRQRAPRALLPRLHHGHLPARTSRHASRRRRGLRAAPFFYRLLPGRRTGRSPLRHDEGQVRNTSRPGLLSWRGASKVGRPSPVPERESAARSWCRRPCTCPCTGRCIVGRCRRTTSDILRRSSDCRDPWSRAASGLPLTGRLRQTVGAPAAVTANIWCVAAYSRTATVLVVRRATGGLGRRLGSRRSR